MEEIKLFLCTDNMMVYVKNPKKTTKNCLRTGAIKVSGYKVNTQKSIVFLYMSNEPMEKFKIPLTVPQKNKYLSIK